MLLLCCANNIDDTDKMEVLQNFHPMGWKAMKNDKKSSTINLSALEYMTIVYNINKNNSFELLITLYWCG